jgi:hypothetical protein
MAKELAEPTLGFLNAAQLSEILALGASFDHVAQLAEAGFGYEHIKQLAPSLKVATSAGGLTAADLKALLDGQRKAMRPENETHPGISAFSYPEGDRDRPRPELKRPTYFAGGLQREDSLTPLEIDLFNRFETTRSSRNGRWRALLKQNGSAQELYIDIADAKSLDGRIGLPPLTSILRELLDGEEAANPDLLFARVTELEAKIRALTAGA